MSLLLNPSLYEALQILPNVALFLLVFVEFHAQLLFTIALFLLNFLNSTCAIGALLLLKFHNYDRAIFIRCATLIRYRRVTHLAKRSSNLKQNGTQEKTPFSGTVFHTHGVLHFVVSVSFKNH